mgnify:CR=1 FL=1
MRKKTIFIVFFIGVFISLGGSKNYGQQEIVKGKYVNGKKEGSWKYYAENGKVIKKGKYKEGKEEGLWKFYDVEYYYSKGKVQIIGKYKEGKEEGLWKYFDLNGKIDTEVNYKKGKEHGAYKSYNEKGQIIQEGNYNEGKLDGLWKYYSERGNITEEENYKHDMLEGLYKSYNEKGQIIQEGNYKNGSKEGLWTETILVLEEREETNYKNGKKDGVFKRYDLSKSTTIPKDRGQYKNNIAVGLWTIVDPLSGKVKFEREYFDYGNPNKYTRYSLVRDEYYENGQPKREYQEWLGGWVEKEGPYREFFKNGSIKEQGELVNGEKTGKWTYFHDNGKVFTEKTFVEGVVADGQYKEYNKGGELEKETTYLFQEKILEKTFNNTIKLYSFDDQGESIEEECCEIEKDWNDAKHENTILSFGKFKEKYSASGLSKAAERLVEIRIKNINQPELDYSLLEKKDSLQREVYKLETDLIKTQEAALTIINEFKPSSEELETLISEKLREGKKQEDILKDIEGYIELSRESKTKQLVKQINRKKNKINIKKTLIVPVQKEIEAYIKLAEDANKEYASYLKYFSNSNFVYEVYLKQLDLESDIRKAQGNPFGDLSFSEDQKPLNSLSNEEHLITVANYTKWLGLKDAQDILVSYKGFTTFSVFHEGSFQVKIDGCESNILPAGRYTITVSSKEKSNITEYRTNVMELKGGSSRYPFNMYVSQQNTSNEKTTQELERLRAALSTRFGTCYENAGWQY